MSRPIIGGISRTDALWFKRLNDNFEKLIDNPFPPAVYTDLLTLSANKDARLYSGCVAVAGGVLYISDGTSWMQLKEQLAFIDFLDTATATVEDMRTAYNSLLADMKAKDWMATS